MSTPSHPLSDALPPAHVIAPLPIPESRRILWGIRRELWEFRSLYLAPLAVAALIFVGTLVSLGHLPDTLRAAAQLSQVQQQQVLQQHYLIAELLIMGTSFLIALFYSLEALQSERRDRSILFWKSLPVSDLTTVLSKAAIPLVVLPLLTFVITLTLQAMMLLVSTVVALASGLSVATLWNAVSPGSMSLMLLYHLVAVHALWYAPIYGWLLLVSAWARRAAFLWAVLPLLAIGVVEKIAFSTSYFGAMLMHRLSGEQAGGDLTAISMSMDPLSSLTLGRFLLSPGLWIGLALTAAFLAAAVRLRHDRGPA